MLQHEADHLATVEGMEVALVADEEPEHEDEDNDGGDAEDDGDHLQSTHHACS